MTTFSSLISHLTDLARETGAELHFNVQSELWGSSIQLFWSPTGSRHNDVPRETTMFFEREEGDVDSPDRFIRAFVVDVDRWFWAVEEGLTPEQADHYATRLVTEAAEVENYLMGRPYRFARDGRVSA
jgi:hypothetical protein